MSESNCSVGMTPASVCLSAFTITMTRIACSFAEGSWGRAPPALRRRPLPLPALTTNDAARNRHPRRRNLLGNEPHQSQCVTVGVSKLPELELALVRALHHRCWPQEAHAALLQHAAQRVDVGRVD